MLFVNQPPRANRRFTDDELIAPGTMVDRTPRGHSCPAARCRPLERHAHRNSLHSPLTTGAFCTGSFAGAVRDNIHRGNFTQT
jgi:hypothetical protein